MMVSSHVWTPDLGDHLGDTFGDFGDEIRDLKGAGIFSISPFGEEIRLNPSSEYDSNDAVDFNGFGDFVGIDTITYDDVVVATKKLKSTSAIGIDNIPPFIINPLNGSNISAECFENGPSVAKWCTQIAPRFIHGRREKWQSKFSFPLCLLFRITAG
ncbi:hypothetical protein AVEN_5437-1 [Araneus ventricosus]|uniref:Uncharacterized protein n=1 Tax=Araneus ventricosus TaxID=182803 RepID=A0A4Y2P832_ARAVE|nr:hypothetical protein AVEN_5437-1 [Araneus ventricosus]